jgi:hypothetical protein
MSPPPKEPLELRPPVYAPIPAQDRQSQTVERLVMKRETRQSRQNGRPQRSQRRVVGTVRWRLQRRVVVADAVEVEVMVLGFPGARAGAAPALLYSRRLRSAAAQREVSGP